MCFGDLMGHFLVETSSFQGNESRVAKTTSGIESWGSRHDGSL